ncbi:hypothetical protein [Deinococcus ruber]|uniref:Uncharacterized protein n=1 Tax=Deinococcus ruber TaxID=1848197 RepID=A0A918CPW2_9DEIO|nr:hypothetical protein [Deinococcus ruber]GGR34186.1 hypothetical protein GCM10008957_50490 [Deinococcus ruber]
MAGNPLENATPVRAQIVDSNGLPTTRAGAGAVLSPSATLTMTGSALALPTPPAGTTWADVQPQGGDVRYRLDGTNPTLSVGKTWYEGGDYTLTNAADIAAVRVIGTAGVILDITWRTA